MLALACFIPLSLSGILPLQATAPSRKYCFSCSLRVSEARSLTSLSSELRQKLAWLPTAGSNLQLAVVIVVSARGPVVKVKSVDQL